MYKTPKNLAEITDVVYSGANDEIKLQYIATKLLDVADDAHKNSENNNMVIKDKLDNIIDVLEKKEEVQQIELKGVSVITIKGDKGDTPTKEELIEIVIPLIPGITKGEKGDNYLLTKEDKEEIAKAIKLPIVEKVIEKIETIIETPIVTNEIVEKAIYETPEEIKDKLESLEDDDRLDKKAIKGLNEDLKEIVRNINNVASRGSFGGGGGSSSGGTPALPLNSVQFNKVGAFGGSAFFTYLNNVLLLNPAGTGTTLTNPLLQATNSVNNFTQISIQNKNAGTSASADIIAYPDNNANDITGFADMGFTSSAFTDSAYAVTGANDGYFFVSAPASSGKTGDMVLATDSTGTSNAIKFVTNGFNSTNNERMRILSGGNVGIGKTTPAQLLDLYGGHLRFSELLAPTSTVTAALAGVGAGSVTNGAHSYYVSYVTATGETDFSPISSTVTVVNNATDGKIQLSNIPLGGYGVTARKIYRAKIADAYYYYLLTTINDNTTTTYLDNIADGSLGATGFVKAYINNTTTGKIFVGTNVAIYIGKSSVSVGLRANGQNNGDLNTTAVGTDALANNKGVNNTAVGQGALQTLTGGIYNTAVGVQALYSSTTSNFNTAIGMTALYDLLGGSGNNTAVGYGSGAGITTGVNNTIIGANMAALSSSLSNNIIFSTGGGVIKLQVDANSLATFTAGLAVPITATKTTTYTALPADHTIPCDATSAGFTVTLTNSARQIFVIKKVDSTANGVTIAPASGTIDGAANKVINTQWTALMVQFDATGTNCFIISNF